MFRIKLVVLLFALIGVMVGVSLALTFRVQRDLVVAAEEQLKSANEVVRLASSVAGYSVIHEASDIAASPAVVAAIDCPATAEALAEARRPAPPVMNELGEFVPSPAPVTCARVQHLEALDALKAWARSREEDRANNQLRYLSERDAGFATPRNPDLLIIANAEGVVVARVGFDKDDWFGESRPNMNQFGAVTRTVLGLPQHDLIVWREAAGASPDLVQVGAAPIYVERDGRRELAGTAIVGYTLTDNAAEEAVQLLYGIDIAYFYRGEGNSVSYAGTTAATRPAFLGAMAGAQHYQSQTADAATFAEVTLQANGVVHRFSQGDSTHMVMSTALAKDEAGTGVVAGFVVVTSVTRAVAPLQSFRTIVPVLGVILFIIGVFGVLIAIREFMLPIEEISRGVQEVIAGRIDFMWEVDEKSHLSDLAHSLNVMSARLQGKKDPDAEDTDGDADWQAMAGQPGAARPEARPAGIAGVGNIRGRAATSDDDDDE